jgi:hypothetical protein
LDSGVLELGSGWEKRGALLLQDALPGVEYLRDANNFVDVTVPGALVRAWPRKFSCITGLCYFLNALNHGPDFQPASYAQLCTTLADIYALLDDGGCAVFGIYSPALYDTKLDVDYTSVSYANPFQLNRLKVPVVSNTVSFRVRQTASLVDEQDVENYVTLRIETQNIEVGGQKFEFQLPLHTVAWLPWHLHNAAALAGFSSIEFFDVPVSANGGFGVFQVEEVPFESKRMSHVFLRK